MTRFAPATLVSLLGAGLALAALLVALGLGHSSAPEVAARGSGAKAFARVISDGTFDPKRSRNVTSVTKMDKGFYCLDVAVPVRNVVASGNGVTFNTVAEAGLVGGNLDSGLNCPQGSDVYVVTLDGANAAHELSDRPFYIVMN